MTASPSDYYAVLGIAADADQDAIRAAYRRLAKKHHPDLVSAGDTPSSEKFLEIQEAYDVLRDTIRRAQYDFERARREALEEERRKQREFISKQAQGPVPPAMRAAMPPDSAFPLPQRPPSRSRWVYVGAIGLVAATLGLIVTQHRLKLLANQQDQVTVVRVDEPPRSSPLDGLRRAERPVPSAPPSLAELAREMERLSHQQAARVEAARNKADGQSQTAPPERKPVATPGAPTPATGGQPSNESHQKVDCSGEGRSFYVIRQNNAVSVSFNGGPLVHPLVSDTAAGMIVMSKVEPSNRISIGFLKGDKDGTIVLITDAVGNVFRTFGVECSAAAF